MFRRDTQHKRHSLPFFQLQIAEDTLAKVPLRLRIKLLQLHRRHTPPRCGRRAHRVRERRRRCGGIICGDTGRGGVERVCGRSTLRDAAQVERERLGGEDGLELLRLVRAVGRDAVVRDEGGCMRVACVVEGGRAFNADGDAPANNLQI